jgi:hypothetical protein
LAINDDGNNLVDGLLLLVLDRKIRLGWTVRENSFGGRPYELALLSDDKDASKKVVDNVFLVNGGRNCCWVVVVVDDVDCRDCTFRLKRVNGDDDDDDVDDKCISHAGTGRLLRH